MQDDLEAFLKRAAQQRAARRQQPPPNLIVEAEVVDDGLVELVEDDIVPIESVSESVSSHVQGHISPSAHTERISHLGEQVGHADEKLESHLHQVFDHKVGQLSSKSVTDDAYEESVTDDPYAEVPADKKLASRSFAAGLADMLRSPQSLRQAVLLSEILARPESRW